MFFKWQLNKNASFLLLLINFFNLYSDKFNCKYSIANCIAQNHTGDLKKKQLVYCIGSVSWFPPVPAQLFFSNALSTKIFLTALRYSPVGICVTHT